MQIKIDESNQIEAIKEKRFFKPVCDIWVNPIDRKTIYGVGQFSVTNDYIYAKYYGNVYIEGDLDWYDERRIAVFDWEGEPVCLYALDWDVYSFVVDEERNRCYLVGADEEGEVQLGFFDL